MAGLKNTVAIVTGGASGIGLALARAYGKRGTHVLIADIDANALQNACRQLASENIAATSVIVDLRRPEMIDEMLGKAKELGLITAVCMNAGVTSTGATIWETPPEVFDFIVDINLRGLFNTIRGVVPELLTQNTSADIVITASMAGMVTSATSGAYAASKAGAIAFAKALRAELAATAPFLRIALLNPGMVKTNLLRSSAAQQPEKGAMDPGLVEGSHEALNQLGVTSDEVAAWVVEALEVGRFWVFPPADDIFSSVLSQEIGEIAEALT